MVTHLTGEAVGVKETAGTWRLIILVEFLLLNQGLPD